MTTSVLGTIPPEVFLRDYWQQAPLLIRDACPDYESPISADELAGLATDAEVESRLVIEAGSSGPWELRHGPFADEDFAALPESHWSLLVQAVDLWVPESRKLLERFNFLPAWRLDDLMVSYAPPGGSVGPHYDQYDVFLLQVSGERRWQLGGECDEMTPLVPGTDLRIVQNFEVQEDWVLKPGDMLYLPPNVAHWGVAESECLTFSIGFRSPLLTDMLGDLALELAVQSEADAPRHYRDPPLTPAMASDEVDAAYLAKAKQDLLALINDDAVIADWFARYMTQPKYPDLLEVTGEQREARVSVGKNLSKRYKNGEPCGE